MLVAPRHVGVESSYVYLGASAALLIFALGGSDVVLVLMGVARPCRNSLQAIVDRTAERCGFAPPEVYEIDVNVANAWAFPTTGKIYLTRKIVEALTPDEIETVLLHETAHLQESRGEVALRLAPWAVYMLLTLTIGVVNDFGLSGVAALLGVIAITSRFARRTSNRLEIKADGFASRCLTSPEIYARALETIYRLNFVPAVIGGSTTHPDLYDRMLAAGATPGYARPRRPSRWRAPVAIGLFLIVLVGGLFVTEVALRVFAIGR
jgi:Zn-dependent protease with chaperone function